MSGGPLAGRMVYLAAFPPGRLSRFELPVDVDMTFVGVTSWAAFEAELSWFGLPSFAAIDFDHLEAGVGAAALFVLVGMGVRVVVLTEDVEGVSDLLGPSARVIPKSSDLNALLREIRTPNAHLGALLRGETAGSQR